MKRVLSVFLFTLSSLLLFSQSDTPVFVKDSLDIYVNRALKEWNIPGAAVAIVKDGQVIVTRGFGKQTINREDRVDENTLFLIGSNTKAFTGTLLAWLAYDRKCSLNDKVVKWLPGFKMKDPWVANELNLADIVCHRMGMETFQGDFMYWASALTKDEVIEKFGMLTPMYSFRTKWGYTNAGFTIAGECIEKISGESWETNLRRRIFDPLQMSRSKALCTEFPLQKNIATPHTIVFDSLRAMPWPDFDNLAPAASISSSVNDMSHWLICQLDSGRYNGAQVIPFPVIKETRRPKSILGNASHPFNTSHYRLYGMGWGLADYEGREVISHTGGVNGFVTSVTLVPEEKLGIVVLTNTDMNDFYEALKWEILDSYLNLPYRNYSGLYLGYARSSAEADKVQYHAQRDTIAMHNRPAAPLKNFAGHYVHPVYGYIDIKKTGENLTMTFEHHPGLTAKLELLSGSRFLCTYSDPLYGIKVLPFKTENDRVKTFTLRVADFLEFTTYEFVKQ